MIATEGVRIGLPMIECEKFFYHHESKGWKIGNTKMKSWTAAMQTWLIRWKQDQAPEKPKTVFEITKIIEACEKEMLYLEHRHADRGPFGLKFHDDEHKKMFVELKKKVVDLRRNLTKR